MTSLTSKEMPTHSACSPISFRDDAPAVFVLTYATLAAIVKYPFSSQLAGSKQKSDFLPAKKRLFKKIAHELGLKKISKEGEPLKYCRHPLVYLVEAADEHLLPDDGHRRCA